MGKKEKGGLDGYLGESMEKTGTAWMQSGQYLSGLEELAF